MYFFQLPTTAHDRLHQSWFFPFLEHYIAAAIVPHLSCLQWNISRYTTKVRVLPDVSLLSPLFLRQFNFMSYVTFEIELPLARLMLVYY